MEPVHGGRDDIRVEDPITAVDWAAMEPVHGGRDDRPSTPRPNTTAWPQWSPSTEDGTTGATATMWPSLMKTPQWSPSTEDGTTAAA
mgnify:CR=1 FL=1